MILALSYSRSFKKGGFFPEIPLGLKYPVFHVTTEEMCVFNNPFVFTRKKDALLV